MIKIPLQHGKEVIFDDSMREVVESHRWYLNWTRSKKNPNFYAQIHFYDSDKYKLGLRGQTGILAHHVVMGKPIKGFQVDHINGDSLDNRRENLRIVTPRQNAQNKNYHRGEKAKQSKYIGVNWDKSRSKWVSYAYKDHKHYFVGRFSSEEAAFNAYKEKLKELKIT